MFLCVIIIVHILFTWYLHSANKFVFTKMLTWRWCTTL